MIHMEGGDEDEGRGVGVGMEARKQKARTRAQKAETETESKKHKTLKHKRKSKSGTPLTPNAKVPGAVDVVTFCSLPFAGVSASARAGVYGVSASARAGVYGVKCKSRGIWSEVNATAALVLCSMVIDADAASVVILR
jgi:hypothetical protein